MRKNITLNASLSALAPSFSSLFLPEMKTFKANGVPADVLDLWHSMKALASI